MRFTALVTAAAILALEVSGGTLQRRNGGEGLIASRHDSKCPPFDKSTFNITAYQLYPENMDWDAKLCQVYVGCGCLLPPHHPPPTDNSQ